MKLNLLFIIALFVCVLSYGQGEMDAYRYSNNDLSGTARGQAMGGAFGALGGDVTGVAINPAGIGIYRSSEIVANMSLTSPMGNYLEGNAKFHFDNLSYISYYPYVKGSMLSLNFGFNYSRIKSFDQRYTASRPGMNSSLTDYMVILTNGIGHDRMDMGNFYSNSSSVPWLGALAWDGGLINKGNANYEYISILNEDERVRPSLKVSEKGKVESYDFTIGSNIANTFYWGATLSIIDLLYVLKSEYDEDFLGEEGGGFNLTNYLETKGSGLQVKLGAIFKPTDVLRLGLSYHSPVWYSMSDYYQAGLTPRGIYFGDKLAGYTSTPESTSNYNLRTPGSLTFSLAAVLGTQAIVSIDYENKNYAFMNLKDDRGKDFAEDNSYIKEDYKSTSTVRAGLEFRFTPQFSGRLGYAWAQNPYRSDIVTTGERVVTAGTVPHYALSGNVNYMTAGLGFRFTPQFYGDLALVLRTQDDNLYFFPPDLQGTTLADSFQGTFANKTLKALVTLGYRF